MGALTGDRSLESEIADCHWAIGQATDPGIALGHWRRLRELLAQRTAAENHLFGRETGALERESGRSGAG